MGFQFTSLHMNNTDRLFQFDVRFKADIGFEFSVRDRENKLILSSAVSASRSSDGEAGGACEGGATSLSEAISKAFREALERYAERVSNSTKLREAFAPPPVEAS